LRCNFHPSAAAALQNWFGFSLPFRPENRHSVQATVPKLDSSIDLMKPANQIPPEIDFGDFGDLDGPDSLEKAKSKLIMDFGLNRPAPERITIEVLKQLIREKPERICQAVRQWLHQPPER